MIKTIQVLDKGYVKYIGHMGSDESVIEAARMSTGKGFLGWYWEEDTFSDCVCEDCETHLIRETLPSLDEECCHDVAVCTVCWGNNIQSLAEAGVEPERLGRKGAKRDLTLLEYLYSNRHSTPFEMGDLCIEVKAPIFVFREWHRHRMQSYNEFSARYSMMPNEHYVPELDRIQYQGKANKQTSSGSLPTADAGNVIGLMTQEQALVYKDYEQFLEMGVSKEVARINTPVSRYSRMRAKTDLRNWLGFLSLRMEMGAQWEIRMYANAVASIVKKLFPRSFELFVEWDFLGQRFSRTEMQILRALMDTIPVTDFHQMVTKLGLTPKQAQSVHQKIVNNKEDLYKEVLEKL